MNKKFLIEKKSLKYLGSNFSNKNNYKYNEILFYEYPIFDTNYTTIILWKVNLFNTKE